MQIKVRFADGKGLPLPDGKALADAKLDKYYLIKSLAAEGEVAILYRLRENDKVSAFNWNGEETVGFF